MSTDDRLVALTEIETERLSLVPLAPGDAEVLCVLTDDPVITQAVDFLPSPFTLWDAQALIRSSETDRDRFLGIKTLADCDLIGVVGVHLRGDDEIEIGYWIGTRYAGVGYATEAVRGLTAKLTNLFPDRQIVAECRPENVASWAVLTKVGFVATGSDGKRAGRKLLVLSR